MTTALTLEDALALPAGPKLDRLIGERLMGVREVHRRKGTYDLVVPGGVDQIDFVDQGACWSMCPKYSTDLAAAWEVASYIGKLNFMVLQDAGSWSAGWHDGSHVGSWSVDVGVEFFDCPSPTPALAICRAALKATWKAQ